MVRQILIKRSQLQPAINAAAAGGKMIATRMRQTSEALMDMFVKEQVVRSDVKCVERGDTTFK